MTKTRQEMFNIAYTGLAKQEFKMSGLPDHCLYRSDVGRCAIGHLIPDENYSEDLENKSATADVIRDAAGIDKNEDYIFINDLQSCHDISYGPLDMMERLHRFADMYALSIPNVE